MALLGEEVVEEWLNRNGYFTIRGIKLGVHEIDILAFRPHTDGHHECRHIEVQISSNPISYICRVPKRLQREHHIAPNNAKTRPKEVIEEGIREWIANKFEHPKKVKLRDQLYQGEWTRELVVNQVKHGDELPLFEEAGIKVFRLETIVREMIEKRTLIEAASGNDLFTLMRLLEKVEKLP